MSLAAFPLPATALIDAFAASTQAALPFASSGGPVLEAFPSANVSVRTNVSGGVDLHLGNLGNLARLQPEGLTGARLDVTAVNTLRNGERVVALVIHLGAGEPESDNGASGLPKWRLKRVFRHIEANLEEPITVADLAEVAGLSPSYFAQQFRQSTGQRPHDYVMQRRIRYAQELLMDPRVSVIEAAVASGFQTQAHFTTVFHKIVGHPPRRWRRDHCQEPELAAAR